VFHAARPGLPGGFIGVDVFFVLSGFLVTRMLIAHYAKTGRSRIADFYA
jgi:peptidoglycan/LPS O-acetylase OafA/YrhL